MRTGSFKVMTTQLKETMMNNAIGSCKISPGYRRRKKNHNFRMLLKYFLFLALLTTDLKYIL